MVGNYLKVAARNLWKQKLFSIINLLGFSLGLTVTLLILLYVRSEVSYDSSHKNGDEIYRVLRTADLNGAGYLIGVTSGPFGPALENDFPGTIQQAVRVLPTDGLVTYQNHSFLEKKFYLADADFFEMFSFPLERGDPATVLDQPNSVVLTPEMAQKYFGESDPLGKTILLDEDIEFVVTGVLAPPPGRSHLDFDFLSSIQVLERFDWFHNWWNNNLLTYVRIASPELAEQVKSQFPGFMDKYFAEDFKRTGGRIDLTLMPLSEVYFAKDIRYDQTKHGDKQAVYIFSIIAGFILLLACVNFMNLTTARSGRRAKEIGVRKVLGAFRRELIWQFLTESFLMTLLAILLAATTVELLLPYFNAMFDLGLSVDFTEVGVISALAILLLLVSLLAGSYPAFLLSSFQPQRTLKSQNSPKSHGVLLRKGLVIFQFCVSIFLIIGTLLVGRQLDYLRDKDLGFLGEQVAIVKNNNMEIVRQEEAFKTRLRNEPEILAASAMTGAPGGFHDTMSFGIVGQDQNRRLRTVFTDFDYVKSLGLNIVAGRDFSREFGTDVEKAVLLNETAARNMGWSSEEAIGRVMYNTMTDNVQKEVVGVVADFHFSSLKNEIDPLIITLQSNPRIFAIKIRAGEVQQAVAKIESHWHAIAPAYPLELSFLDDNFFALYKQERTESRLFSSFAFISVIIACLGIFALAAFAAEERTKEVGIRKVLGATVTNVTVLLSLEFVRLVAVANLIAWPLAWFAMNQWLEVFAYRTNIGLGIFLLSGGLALAIALFTVGTQAVKAALANPIESLRYE